MFAVATSDSINALSSSSLSCHTPGADRRREKVRLGARSNPRRQTWTHQRTAVLFYTLKPDCGVRLVLGISACPHYVERSFKSASFRCMNQARMHKTAKCCPAQLSRPTPTDEQNIAVSEVANRVGDKECRCPFCVRKLSYQNRVNHVFVSCNPSGQEKNRVYRWAATSRRRSISKKKGNGIPVKLAANV